MRYAYLKWVNSSAFLLFECQNHSVEPTPLQWSKFNSIIDDRIVSKLCHNPHIEIHKLTVYFTISLNVKLGYLPKYIPYQNLLLSEIRRRRPKGWMYKQIAAYLTNRGYLSTRGKPLSAKLIERMYKSSLTKEESEGAVDVSIGDIQVIRS